MSEYAISIEEFKKLSEKYERATIPADTILALIQDQALSTAQIAEHLGIETMKAGNRLKRLLDKGLVIRRFKHNKAFWLAASALEK